MNKQAVIYDGDCPVCRVFSQTIKKRDLAENFEFRPSRSVKLSGFAMGLNPQDFKMAVVTITGDGRFFTGVEAVAEIFKQLPNGWRLLGTIISLPVIRHLAAIIYRVIAHNRYFLSRFIK